MEHKITRRDHNPNTIFDFIFTKPYFDDIKNIIAVLENY